MAITTGTPDKVIDGYDQKSTQGQTSCEVKGLAQDNVYRLVVAGTDGEYTTPKAELADIMLTGTGVEEIGYTESNDFKIEGRVLHALNPLEVYDTLGRRIAQGRAKRHPG